MKAEIIKHTNVKGKEKYYLKLTTNNNKEHYMTISELNVDAIKELEKQQELPLKPAKDAKGAH